MEVQGDLCGSACRIGLGLGIHVGGSMWHIPIPALLSCRYILWEAEDKGLELPYACRMGCCTVCAVRIKEGEMYQPESLGISEELRAQGYALMCVGYPLTDLVLETVSEDEVYELQFGESFATQVRAWGGVHVCWSHLCIHPLVL